MQYEIQLTSGVEGPHLAVWPVGEDGKVASSGFRMCGPKAWGGGTVVNRWRVKEADVREAFPEYFKTHEQE